MMSIWAPMALTGATAAMLGVPFVPAVLELVRRRDAEPLPTRKDDGNIRAFAESFRYILPLQPALALCADRHAIEETQLRDGDRALLVGRDGLFDSTDKTLSTQVLFARKTWLPAEMTFANDVYAAGILHGGKRNIFRAILGDDDIVLSEESQVFRWTHSEGTFYAAPDCKLWGRLSAARAVCLSVGCGFERVTSPLIVTAINAGPGVELPSSNDKRILTRGNKLGRSRIRGDLHLGPAETFMGNIVATGSISIDDKTRIFGSAKAHGDALLGSQAEVDGSVISCRTVRIGERCYIKGPLLAEEEIFIGSGTQIGTPSSPTTISAPRIHVAPDCRIHGTLWARLEGRVEA